ncbi:four and a half LIM domains protein 5-like isoform X2 [Artemia franciscana]|uniref:LIM zinc-binding domain-containing protein n=1 Tax=Artemia franciscana TaxID=6661 RepID=A0AA88LA96_ARTSF|nr:hypothetical protein QYM36_003246 [Artemia franciscana]
MSELLKKLKDDLHLGKNKRDSSSSSSDSSDDEDNDKGAVISSLDSDDTKFKCALKKNCREGDHKKRTTGSKKVEYKKKQWHDKCFVCEVCKTDFSNKSFLYKEKNFYCQSCYHDKFAPKCQKCSKNILNEVLKYDGGAYHKDCFVCHTCRLTLAGKKFMKHDGNLVCTDCYSKSYAKTCHSCTKAVMGDVIVFEDKHWHKDCFVCHTCNSSLAGNKFLKSGEHLKCEKCAR